MKRTATDTRLIAIGVTMGTLAGCASSDPNPNADGKGGAPVAGAFSVGGSSSAGAGASGAIIAAGGTLTSGGAGGAGAGAPGAGSTSLAGADNSGGVGGSSGGGQASGGGAGSAGTGGSTSTAKASPGCGKGGRPANGKVQVAGESLTDFPTSYDGTKPFPLLIGLHACGNPNTEFENLTKGSAFESEFVRTFPNTTDSGQCWSSYAANSARILKQYDDLLANYCIDMNRVYAVAHSSGAQMLVNVLSHKSDAQHLALKGVAPVAADPYNVAISIPVLYIDGKMDNQRSPTSAADTLKRFRAANQCLDTSKPYAPVMTCKSTEQGNPSVDPGCISYDNCTAPTIWCSHNDPSYGGTQHGVPCFAIKSMYDFFKTLP